MKIREEFASVKDAQAGLTRIVRQAEQRGAFCRVMRNNKPIAALLPEKLFAQLLPLINVAAEASVRGMEIDWDTWLENWEAAHSPSFVKAMHTARRSKAERSAESVFAKCGV
jgi:hypothetical protein